MDSFFGIGLAELFFIAIIALIVLGPERLPGAIREISKFLRMARNLSNELTSQFSEEMKAFDDINPQKILRDLSEDPEEEKKAANKKPAAKPATKSATTKPAASKTTTSSKATAKPSTAKSATAKPDTAQPSTAKPAAGKPATDENADAPNEEAKAEVAQSEQAGSEAVAAVKSPEAGAGTKDVTGDDGVAETTTKTEAAAPAEATVTTAAAEPVDVEDDVAPAAADEPQILPPQRAATNVKAEPETEEVSAQDERTQEETETVVDGPAKRS